MHISYVTKYISEIYCRILVINHIYCRMNSSYTNIFVTNEKGKLDFSEMLRNFGRTNFAHTNSM